VAGTSDSEALDKLIAAKQADTIIKVTIEKLRTLLKDLLNLHPPTI
jgi:hypothetical protein